MPPAVGTLGEAPGPAPPGPPGIEPAATGADVPPLWCSVSKQMLPAIALESLKRGEVGRAVSYVRRIGKTAPTHPELATPPLASFVSLLREFGKSKAPRGVAACLDAMAASSIEPDAEAYQAMVNALVHQVTFVKGGVSMDTLPQLPLPEVAFVGRSNVGKSSLINMVLGRKYIAYTSKTPGKTQQYNYFIVNEARGDDGAYHIVDMPGLGFAKVPGADRRRWLSFLSEYFVRRPQLKAIVHLVDSQVGPTETDLKIMEMVGNASRQLEGESSAWQYAIVLTKADKIDGKVKPAVMHGVDDALIQAGCPREVPVLVTSAKSCLGRDAVWRFLCRKLHV